MWRCSRNHWASEEDRSYQRSNLTILISETVQYLQAYRLGLSISQYGGIGCDGFLILVAVGLYCLRHLLWSCISGRIRGLCGLSRLPTYAFFWVRPPLLVPDRLQGASGSFSGVAGFSSWFGHVYHLYHWAFCLGQLLRSYLAKHWSNQSIYQAQVSLPIASSKVFHCLAGPILVFYLLY